MSILLWVLVLQGIISGGCLPQCEGHLDDDVDPGEPLFLTPYIERNQIYEGRQAALVKLNGSLEIKENYAGFFTVNKEYNSNQFFWYFRSLEAKESAPVLLYLHEGPGASSLYSLFVDNGPITVKNGHFENRLELDHWAVSHHLIYIDNPVGAGFSFTQHEQGYCTDETQVGEQLYSTVTQFFQIFPESQKHDFYIAGDGYAGKYVTALAYTIHKKNPVAKTNINLKGLAMGGAWVNPESQWKFSEVKMNSEYYTSKHVNYNENDLNDGYVAVLTKNYVRKAIHVGNLPYTYFNHTVWDCLQDDFDRSVAPWLSELLDYYPVTFYSGDLDKRVPYAGIVDFLRNHLNFTGAEEYRAALQYGWRTDYDLWAGCKRQAGFLTEILVFGAGHCVAKDQPSKARNMIDNITYGSRIINKDDPCPMPS